MKLKKILTTATKYLDKKSPAVLTGLAIVGVIGTAVTAYKAGLKADKILEDKKKDMEYVKKNDEEAEKAVKKNTIKKIIPVIIPPIIMSTSTIVCVLGSNKVSNKRIALLSAAYQLSEKTVEDLNKKMVETIGEKKARAIKDKIIKDKVDNNPPNDNLIIVGDGDILCYDSPNSRYFKASIEKVKQAILEASQMVMNESSIKLNDFYGLINPKLETELGDLAGWTIDDLYRGKLPIEIVSHLTDDGKPCLALEYDVHIKRNNWYGDFA